MKNRSLLAIIELTVMILFFALAAAVCVDCFVRADQRSAHNAARDEAMLQAECTAELLKSLRGDLSAQPQYTADGNGWQSTFLCGKTLCCMTVTLSEPQPLLGSAEILVTDSSGSQLATLQVCWQEVAYE